MSEELVLTETANSEGLEAAIELLSMQVQKLRNGISPGHVAREMILICKLMDGMP